eukprot:2048496-Rhodomonas_salina.1
MVLMCVLGIEDPLRKEVCSSTLRESAQVKPHKPPLNLIWGLAAADTCGALRRARFRAPWKTARSRAAYAHPTPCPVLTRHRRVPDLVRMVTGGTDGA